MPYKTSELVTLDKFIFSAFNGLIKRGPLEFYCIQVKSVFHILCSSPSCGSFKCSKCFQFQVSKSASYLCFLFFGAAPCQLMQKCETTGRNGQSVLCHQHAGVRMRATQKSHENISLQHYKGSKTPQGT